MGSFQAASVSVDSPGWLGGDVDGSFEQFAFEHVRVGLLKEPDIRAPIRSLITLELMPAFSAAVHGT